MKYIKKIHLLIFFLALGFIALAVSPIFADNEIEAENTMMAKATTTNNGLEKIPSPDQIKYFRNIIKHGNDLFGLRLEASSSNQVQVENNNRERKLEKIAAPQYLGLYERIQKIGNALWGYKKDDADKEGGNEKENIELEDSSYVEMHIQSPSDMSLFKNIRKTTEGKLYGILKDKTNIPERYFAAIRPFVVVGADERACVEAAIKEKDSAISANNLKFAEDLNAAISNRQACQLEAISKEEGQELAIKECALDFNMDIKEIRLNTRETQKSAWQTYKDDLKACSGLELEAQAEIMIEDGGEDIY